MRTVDWRMTWEDHAEPGQLRRVLSALSNSMGGHGGQNPDKCAPSMERIARRAGMRRDSASRWVRVAEEEGWINVGRITGLRNRYWATLPKEYDLAATGQAEQTEPRKPDAPPTPSPSNLSRDGCPECGWHQTPEMWVKEGKCQGCGSELPT